MLSNASAVTRPALRSTRRTRPLIKQDLTSVDDRAYRRTTSIARNITSSVLLSSIRIGTPSLRCIPATR